MSEKKVLSAADILGAEDLQVIEVEVPEWGGVVRLRPMTAEEAIGYNKTVTAGDKRHGAVILAGMCIVNDEGKPAFSDEQVQQLAKKSLAALMRIQRVALKINGLTKDEEAVIKND